MPQSKFVQKLVSKGFLARPGSRPFKADKPLSEDRRKLGHQLEELVEVTREALADGKLTPFELVSIGQAVCAVLLGESKAKGKDPVQSVTTAVEEIKESAPVVGDTVLVLEKELQDLKGADTPAEVVEAAKGAADAAAGVVETLVEEAKEVAPVVAEAISEVKEAVSDAKELVDEIRDALDGDDDEEEEEKPKEETPKKGKTPRRKKS